jgi:hypothetical protein
MDFLLVETEDFLLQPAILDEFGLRPIQVEVLDELSFSNVREALRLEL